MRFFAERLRMTIRWANAVRPYGWIDKLQFIFLSRGQTRNGARAQSPNAVPLWMWGVKEKDMDI